MTERDKKLLVILSCFVLIAGFVFLNMKLMDKIDELAISIETSELEKEVMESKITHLAETQILAEESKILVQERRTNYYPMIKSQEIDKEITQLMIQEGFMIMDMNIVMPQESLRMAPYVRSEMAGALSEDESAGRMSTIYTAKVSLTLTGNLSQFWNMVEILSTYDKAMRITDLNIQEKINIDDETQGFTMGLELYMCK